MDGPPRPAARPRAGRRRPRIDGRGGVLCRPAPRSEHGPPGRRGSGTGASTCASSAGGGSVLVRDGASGCPDAAAVLHGCARRLDPVLTFLGPEERVFLGGRFALTVPRSATAAYVGAVDGLAVYREAGVDGRLFVDDGARAARWLALPDAPEVEANAFVLGDSIALGAADRLTASLPSWTTTIDAEIGRTAEEGVPVVAALDPASAGAIVVELGTNDVDASSFASGARAILRAVATEPLVVWVAPHAPAEVTEEVRRVIHRLVARTPNGVVADWSAAVPPDALATDGVHLLPDRVDEFASFVAGYLRSWRMAVEGRGATSCATTA